VCDKEGGFDREGENNNNKSILNNNSNHSEDGDDKSEEGKWLGASPRSSCHNNVQFPRPFQFAEISAKSRLVCRAALRPSGFRQSQACQPLAPQVQTDLFRQFTR
jgi:hypothetical protein